MTDELIRNIVATEIPSPFDRHPDYQAAVDAHYFAIEELDRALEKLVQAKIELEKQRKLHTPSPDDEPKQKQWQSDPL